VADRAEVVEAVEAAHGVHASRALRDYIVALLRHTRGDSRVELGASPRAGLMLLRAAKARALVQGRDHALPDDVQGLAQTVLAHRLMLVPEAAGVERGTIVADAIAATPAL
jgi:MoxR-like ATPase